MWLLGVGTTMIYCHVAFCVGCDVLVLLYDVHDIVVLCKILLWIVFSSFFFAVSYVFNASSSPSHNSIARSPPIDM